MKRKTRNIILLEVVKRQEKEIEALQRQIKWHEAQEQRRDEAWTKFNDERIRDINSAIRASNSKTHKVKKND